MLEFTDITGKQIVLCADCISHISELAKHDKDRDRQCNIILKNGWSYVVNSSMDDVRRLICAIKSLEYYRG
jgi:uncharacterized protein YlzI (FlbEa/FlbD family)